MLTQVGKYQIVEKIGVGGFGSVYKGRDPFIKRAVAIKTCQSDEEEIKKRFFREAEYAGNLQHRNITTIYDFGVTEEGVPYIVQEFLTGEDLDKKIKRKEAIPLQRKVKILLDVCEGLGYAHVNGIIHRDIKPSNIRILENGTVKIMDFGIAKSMVSQSTLTQTGITLGTASYLAPEQIRGESVDPRTDLFSLGVLAFEFLTSQKPFTGDHISTVLYKILNEHPPNPNELDPSVPIALGTAVLHSLEKDRTKRPDSCDALKDELVNGLGGLGELGGQDESASVRPSGFMPAAQPELEETMSTPTGGLPQTSAAKSVQSASRRLTVDSTQITTGNPPAGTASSIGDVNIHRHEDAAPSSAAAISAPRGEGGGALKILLASAAVLLLAGGASYYFLTKKGAAGQAQGEEPSAPKATTGEAQATPAAEPTFPPDVEPTAAPTAAPTPGPTVAPAYGSAIVSSNYYANLSIDKQRRQGVLAAVRIGSLKPGRHRAVFETEGFPPMEKSFEIRAGENVEVRAEFPPRGQLQVQVNYEARDAEIRLDGQSIGRAPVKRTVKAGSHRLEASLPGFETVTKTIQVPEEDKLDLRIVLPKKAGETAPAQ